MAAHTIHGRERGARQPIAGSDDALAPGKSKSFTTGDPKPRAQFLRDLRPG